MEVLVEHDYDAQETDELTIRRGDRLTNVSQSVEGWYTGTLGNKTGLFPDNFVKIVTKPNVFAFEETPSVQLRPKKAGERRLRVLFSYAAEQDDELSLAVGDTIDFLSEVEDGWFKGSLNGQVGIFPSNFVSDSEAEAPASTNGVAIKGMKRSSSKTDEGDFKKDAPPPDVVPEDDKKIVEEEPAPELPPKPVRELARCFYPYQAQNEDELTLNEGDIVTIVSKNCEDDGWWRGELRGKNGLFPDNFVKILSSKEASAYRAGTHQPQLPSQQIQSSKSPPKIFSQARNSTVGNNIRAEMTPSKPETVTDGTSSSKPVPDAKSKSSTPAKIEAKESFKSRESASSGFGSKLGNIFGIGSKKDSSSTEAMSTTPAVEPEPANDFSSVVRTESTKLNHPTATRVKPPRRRPPSTLIPRDGESDITNGFGHSLDTSSEFSTSMQNGLSPHSFNSPTAASASFTSPLSSAVSVDSSYYTPSRLGPSPASVNGTTPSPSSIGGKQVKRPPWMEELELKQKKGQTTSPVSVTPPTTLPPTVTSTPPNASPPTTFVKETTTDSSPAATTVTVATPPVSAARAPPLPAKPTVADRISMHNSVGSVPSPVSTVSNVSAVSSRYAPPGRKAPTTGSIGTNHSTASITMSSHVITNNNNMNNSTDSLNNSGSEDKPTSKRNSFIKSDNVSYEEYAKLKDRVQYLETELDTVKKQLKLLMEREFSKGHIV